MNKLLALALLLACTPFAASAGELSYTYAQAGYSESSFDDGHDSLDINGYALKGSMAFGDSFYGAVGMHHEAESGEYLEPWELTGGYRHAIADGNDFVAEVSYIGVNSKILGERYHNDGFRVAAGVRSAIGEHFELGAKATWTDVENMDDLVGVNVDALVKINKTWGVYGQYHYNEYNFIAADIDTWQVGARASF